MFFISLDRRGFELFFVATLDPQRAGLLDGRRSAARRVDAARDVMAGFDKPSLGSALFRKLFFASNAAAIGVRRAPDDQARGKLALADGGHLFRLPLFLKGFMYPKDFGWYLVGAGRRDAGTVGDFAKSRF